jgi:hypothetical protein
MDVLASAATAASYFNNRDKPVDKVIKSTKIKRAKPVGDSIYSSDDTPNNKRLLKSIASDRHKLALNPLETGIVPDIYNQILSVKQDRDDRLRRAKKSGVLESFDGDSVFSEESVVSRKSKKSIDTMSDHMGFMRRADALKDNKCYEKNIVGDSKKPEFFNQFDDLAYDNPNPPVSSNNTPHKIGPDARMARLTIERDLALKGGYSDFDKKDGDMTYGVVRGQDFIHNNMVPSFKSKSYGISKVVQDRIDEVKQRKLDTFTGSINNLDYRPKEERRPLFNPQVGLTWVYGMPNFTDYMQPRYIPGRERRNELLQQPVRVTPGLNLGYNEINKNGFNDTWRPLEKTVDELRTANNPKISYGGRVIPGMKGERRGIIPNVAKRRPPRFQENDPRDMLKSLTYYRAPSIYGNFEAPNTNRQMTTRAWYSPANTSPTYHKPDNMQGTYHVPHRENFGTRGPGPGVVGVDQEKNASLTADTYYVQPTNRNTTEKRTYVNPAGPEWQKGQAFDMSSNVPDPTLRNLTEKRTWNNPLGPEWQKGHAFDMNSNVPDPTLRNLTEKKTWNNPLGPEWQKGYAFDMNSNVPDPTLRNLTEKKTWNNPLGPEWQKGYAFDMQTNIPNPTLRNTTEINSNLQGAAPAWKKGPAFDMQTNIPDPTLRNTMENFTQYNPVAPTWQKGPAFDMQTNIPDPTLRNVMEKNTNLVGAGTSWHKGTAFDMQSNIPDPTLRNVTEINTNLVGAGTSWHKGTAFDMQSNIPDPTLRNVTEINSNLIGAGTSWHKGTAFDMQSNIPDMTLRNLTEKNTNLVGVNPWNKGAYQVNVQNTQAPTTIRQLTEKATQYNPMGPNERHNPAYSINVQNTQAPTTIRQLTQNATQYNPIGPKEREHGAYAINVQNTYAPTTLRQLTQNVTQYNPTGPKEREKGAYAINVQNTVAPTTLRQLTQNVTQYNPMGPNDREKGAYTINVQNTIAPPTIRQTTQNVTQYNPLIMHEALKERTRGDIDNSIVNLSKEFVSTVRDGGAPVTSNYEKIPTYEQTMVQLCEPIQIDRELYGNMSGQRPLQCVPTMYTRFGNTLPEQSFRFDTCVVDSLKTNPYINNVVHKSVEYVSDQNRNLNN